MTTVRAIVSEAKHADGLTKFTGSILDLGASGMNVPEWIRRVRSWLELYAIDGTASGLSVTPFVEPAASFPKENGPNSWIPIDPDTGNPATLDDKTLEKLKGAKFVAHAAIQVNLANQARVIFQVLLNSAISKQSQAAVKNSVEWDALSIDLNRWAELLNVIVRVHTIQKGAMVGEAAIVAKFAFDSKIRNFKQTGSTDSGAHLERFDDLVAEGKAIGANLDQRELAYLVVNSMKSAAARNKRSLLMDLSQDTPQSYAVAKAFVLEAEAMARSVAEFNAGHPNRGYAAITDHLDDIEKGTRDTSEVDTEEGTNLVTATSKGTRRTYTAQQKKNWKTLNPDSKKKVTELEQLADKIRAGESIDVDLRTITSALTSSVAPLSEPKKCWKCKGDHVMSECPQKDSIKGAPHAPIRKGTWKPRSQNSQKKSEVVALTQESTQEEDSDDDYYYHLNNLVTYRGCWKSKREPKVHPEASLFLDESEDEDDPAVTHEGACLIIDDLEQEGLEINEQYMQQLRSIRGLYAAVRKPTSEEIVFQADLGAMPRLCRAELERNRWQTTSVNGVTVVKGGCFDTTSTSVVWLRWGSEKVPDIAQSKPSSERPKLASAKRQGTSDEEKLIVLGKQDAMMRNWTALGRKARKERENESGEEESEDIDYEQLDYLKQECEDLTGQLDDMRNDLKAARSQLDLCNTEKHRAKLEYERALKVVREVATRELDEAKNESVKEKCRLQSEVEKARVELKEKENVVSEIQAESISGSLRRALERNTYLVSCLDRADEECLQEKQQAAFYRNAFEKERADAKAMNERLSEYSAREEERVEAYRKALAEERLGNSSLRRTIKDLEDKRENPHESRRELDEDINRLEQELKVVEGKLLHSVEKGNKTEGRLREAEQNNKEVMEELDRHRTLTFPHEQQTRESPASETRSISSGGRFEALGNEWDEEQEGRVDAGSDCTKKRPPTSVNGAKQQRNSQKKAKRMQKETDCKKQSPSSTPMKQAPVFDPATMRQITPIFGHSGNGESNNVQEEEAQIRVKKRETRMKNELARLAPQNGIDLVGYTSRRTERRDADDAAALEREKAKARKSILWNCSQSLEVRANLRVTEASIREVEMREKVYKDMLGRSKEEGPTAFMNFLNEECKYSTHNKLTSEWLEQQVLSWLRNPKDRQKPIKLPIPPRDPVFYQRLVDDREKRESERKRNAERGRSSSESDMTEDKEKKGTPRYAEGEDDLPPELLSDDESDDDDESTGLRDAKKIVEEEREDSVNERIAGESLTTVIRGEGEELTIHDYDVLTLDNGASTHIFRNREMLHSIKPVKGGGVNVGGLKSGGEGVTCTEKGMFLSVTGVLVGDESIANLLSQGMLVDQGHYVAYDTPNDVYTVRFRGTNVSLEFRRQRRAMKDHRNEMMKHYVHKITPQDIREETVLIETIKERQEKYTKIEIAEAVKAREQSAMLNFPSTAAHLDMIAQGSIDGNQVTREALLRSIDIWGRATERSKGNNVHTKPSAASRRIRDLPEQAIRRNSAHADLLFVKGIIFLIVVLDPMNMYGYTD